MTPYALMHDPATGAWWHLEDPAWVLHTSLLDEVRPLLVEGLGRTGSRATICCLAYEAAAAFDRSLRTQSPLPQPLLWMAGFQRLTRVDADALFGEERNDGDPDLREVLFGPWQPEMSQSNYAQAFDAVKAHLRAGDAYQINLTQRYRAQLLEHPTRAGLLQLFVRLAGKHRSPHAILVDTGELALLSFSPETFFERHGQKVRCRPMKGTAARGQTAEQDQAAAQWLQQSEKERAENRMVVDMVRNDLGRIARVGSIAVPTLFAIEHYPSVHQMISEVTAETDAAEDALLAALFPCASVTGAPKVAAMQIIAELEQSPRGFYTGTIGALLPAELGKGALSDRPGCEMRSVWNVGIRTLCIDRCTASAEYGSGGGIVWDSEVDRELAELELKALVLADTAPGFGLAETMLVQADGRVFLQQQHLRRIRASAQVFGFVFDANRIHSRLNAAIAATSSDRSEPSILRLVLMADGTTSVSCIPLSERPMPTPLRVHLARQPMHSQDRLLRHKTTDRRIYAAAAGRPVVPGEEVFLFNEHKELTEGTFTNIVLELDGRWCTPPLAAGLLPGCYREALLAQGAIVERTLTPADLKRAQSIWAINSVRGMMACELMETDVAEAANPQVRGV